MKFDLAKKFELRDCLFGAIHDLARKDPDIVFITCDMGAWRLDEMRKELPSQFINLGIAEQTMVSMAGGMAQSGKRVFIYAISPFLALRSLEQIKLDICGMGLPVVIIGGGPGLTYASDGMTHHALEDIAALRSLPNLKIYSPADPVSTEAIVQLAYHDSGPSYIRMDKGMQVPLHAPDSDFTRGAVSLRTGTDLLILANGIMIGNALEIAAILATDGLRIGVIDAFRASPLDSEYLLPFLRQAKAIVTYEEHFRTGGLGTGIAEIMADHALGIPFRRIGANDNYCFKYGDRSWMWSHYGLNIPTVVASLKQWLDLSSR